MRVKAQYYSEKGLLGPELEVELDRLWNLPNAMQEAFEQLPEVEDGVRRKDWTRMTIEIIRKD